MLWRVTYVRSALPLAMFCELSFFCHFRVLTRVQLIAAWISTVGLVWSTLRISLTRSATGRLALHINALRFDKCSLTRSLGRWLFCLTCPTSAVPPAPRLRAFSRCLADSCCVYRTDSVVDTTMTWGEARTGTWCPSVRPSVAGVLQR